MARVYVWASSTSLCGVEPFLHLPGRPCAACICVIFSYRWVWLSCCDMLVDAEKYFAMIPGINYLVP